MRNPTTELRWVRPPQQVRSQETLERILDAAEALMAEKGFDDTSVGAIVERAGSSVGAFYNRFKDKEGLFYALYDRYVEQALATADDALDPVRWETASIPEILSSVVGFLVSIYRERAGLMRAFALRNYTDPAFRARQERLSHHVSEKLVALLLARPGQIRHEDPERACSFGITVAFSTIESTVLFGETRSSELYLSDDDLAAELTRTYLAYLGVPATT